MSTFLSILPIIIALVLYFTGIPIAYALFAAALTYFGFIDTTTMPYLLMQKFVTATQSFPFLAIPFFIMCGSIMNYGGISARLMDFADALTGHMRGGLAQINVLLSMLMGGCSGSANYYKQAGQFHTSGPQPGDQIFFTKDGGKSFCHTGIVEKVAGGRVYTIEGNTSSAAGVVENGGCVQDKSYPLTYSKIGGYGRPDFSIVPEEDNDMDQTKFNEMFAAAMAEYRKQLRDNDSGDWSQKAREWAVSVGLFAGNGTLDNGEPNMMWEDFLTREQAAQLFYRFALEHGLA